MNNRKQQKSIFTRSAQTHTRIHRFTIEDVMEGLTRVMCDDPGKKRHGVSSGLSLQRRGKLPWLTVTWGGFKEGTDQALKNN